MLFLLLLLGIYDTQSATRLSIEGNKIYFPNGTEAILTGFNMLWDQSIPITPSDPIIAKQYFPNLNVARLVMVHWDDGKRNNPINGEPYMDCKTDNKSNGYLSDACLTAFDQHITWMQQNDIWSIITLRGQEAAGNDYPSTPDIFHNETLKNEFIAMWESLATRYKDTDQIAAFEIMSEPRTNAPLTVVQSVYQEACTAIQNIDPSMVCMIGAAKYYNVCNLNETMIIDNDNVIYAFNWFIPKAYIKVGMVNYTINWPGQVRCCDLTEKCLPGHCQQNQCNSMVDINKEWLENAMESIPIKMFRDKYNKSVLIDQWGVYYNAPNRTGYDQDMLDLMINKFGISSTNWQWRAWQEDNYGMEHNLSNGSYFEDVEQIKVFQNFV